MATLASNCLIDAAPFKFDTMMDVEGPMRFVQKIGVHYPLAVATDELKQKFGCIEGLPTTMLYDRHGMLRKKVRPSKQLI